jgi:outer membrane lipoprotein-sorting protein
MNKFSLLIFTLFICYTSVQCQEFSPISNEAAFKKTYSEKSAAISSLKSDFTQEKTITLLENKIISDGCFQYKKMNKLRMEYFKPYNYLFIMNDDKVTIKNNQKQTSVSTKSNKLFKLISQITVDCVSGDVLDSKDFKTSIFENKSLYLLKLAPNAKELKNVMNEIKIYVSKTSYTVEKIEMYESSGDFTLLIFKNKQINTTIPDEVFSAN